MSRAKARHSQACFLEQVMGPGEGATFGLDAGVVSIGRGDTNDVVLSNGSVSREHAVIEQIGNEFVIRDNGSKNGILVNTEVVKQASLSNGDVVQIGDFAFRFHQPDLQENLPAPKSEKGLSNLGFGLSKKKVKVKGPPNRRPLIYGVAGLVLVWALFMQDDGTTKKAEKKEDQPRGLTTEPLAKTPYLENLDPKKARDPGRKLEALEDPAKTRAEAALNKLDWTNSGLRESEQYFRMGRREYAGKNYQRAIRLFQTSLSFDQKHPLSSFYLQLAVAEVEKEAQTHAEAGLKYFESLQYERAIYHFKQVEGLMVHRRKSDMVARARQYIKVSQDRLRAAELFP